MNESAAILFLLLLVVSFSSQAQQNLFNAPSGDHTARSELFYQHQINLYSPSSWDSKMHLVYGLGKKWDAGINFVDLPIDWSQGLQFSKTNLLLKRGRAFLLFVIGNVNPILNKH